MIYGSVCSGIEAASVAWAPLGWQPAWFAEIDSFCSAVLRYRYPHVPNLGDFTKIGVQGAPPHPAIDLLVGGTPCTDYSIAGERAGMAGDDGRLAVEYVALLGRLRPRWLVWENVPGVLSSVSHRAPYEVSPPDDLAPGQERTVEDEYEADETHDFWAFLSGLSQCGYGVAYRVLDAQYFGVPQRRRRVFVVGYFGDWRPAAAVLLERESLLRLPPPRRDAGQDVAGTLAPGAHPGGVNGQDARAGRLIPEIAATLRVPSHGAVWRGDGCDNVIASPVLSHHGRMAIDDTYVPEVAPTLRGEGHDASEDGSGRQALIAFTWKDGGQDAGAVAPTLRPGTDSTNPGGAGNVAIALRTHFSGANGGAGSEELAYTLDTATPQAVSVNGRQEMRFGQVHGALRTHTTGSQFEGVMAGASVRRLTPLECERLQGFPDNWTLVPWGKNRAKDFREWFTYIQLRLRGLTEEEAHHLASDTPRYRAIGNSMAVPVMRWIARRIDLVEALLVGGNVQQEAAG